MARGLGRPALEPLPDSASLTEPSASRGAPNPVPGLPSSLPRSPAPPQVAAQSPPPPQPRERVAGTEFNRRHQQPPGKLGKVDTLIPATVSGDQAQGRMAGGPTPRRGAWPLPGRCHGEEPRESSQAATCKGRAAGGGGADQVARGTIEVTLTSQGGPSPPSPPIPGLLFMHLRMVPNRLPQSQEPPPLGRSRAWLFWGGVGGRERVCLAQEPWPLREATPCSSSWPRLG